MGSSPSTSARPRVVHLDHTGARGGAELALLRLLAVASDWDATVLLPAPDADDSVFAQLPATVPCLSAGVRQGAGGSGGSAVVMMSLAARLSVQAAATRWHRAVRGSDLIAANSTRAAAYGALAVRGTSRPFVVHLRDLITPESLGGTGYRIMTRLILPRADGVIANSRTTLDSARRFLRTNVVARSIPSAAGIRRGPASSRGGGPLRVGMLARIDPWKGQRDLLHAFAAAFGDGDAVLEIAGGAPFGQQAFLDELHTLAEDLGVRDRVRMLGHVDDTASLLAGWDIAVQYSTRAEPLGQNVLQYLAAGAAVVVADEGGPTEWVDDGANGLRVTPRDPAALSAALRMLASDAPLRSRLQHAAPQTPGLMTDAQVAQAHAEMFQDVLTRRRAVRGA